jgi:hypothetical protein
VEEAAQMTDRVGVKTMILRPDAVGDRLPLIEQDIRALIEIGAVIVTVELLRKRDAEDHQR